MIKTRTAFDPGKLGHPALTRQCKKSSLSKHAALLGFGLPPPTPSLGELLKQGTQTLRTAPWIVMSAFGTLVVLLTLVTFVGEAIRESFDPKKFTLYK